MATAVASAEPAPRRWKLRLPEQLPNLTGKWLTAYTILWLVMVPLSLMGAARGTYVLLNTPPMWSPYGLSTTEDANGLHVDSVFSPSARAAGLRAGDYVVAVDGWTVPRVAGRAAARSHVLKADGASTRFSIRRPGGQTFNVTLVRSLSMDRQRFRDAGVSWPVAKAVNTAGILLLPSLFISAAVLLFVRRRREAVPALLSLSFLAFGAIVNGGDLLGIGITPVQVLGTIGTLSLYAALFAFPSGRFEPRWTAIPFLLLPATAAIPPESEVVGPVVTLSIVLLVLIALVSRYRRIGGEAERLQLRWAFFGLVAGLLLSLLSLGGNAAATAWQAADPRWVAWQYIFVQTFAIWGLGMMALGLIVSILRYRLYDADAVIGRSAAYAVLTAGFVVLFAGSEKLIELLGQEYLGQNVGALAGGVAAALTAVAIAPMHARSHRWAERRFQKGLYRLRHALPPLVGDLRETAGLEQVAGATLDALVDGVRTSRAALIARDELIDARAIGEDEAKAWWRRWTPAAHDGIDTYRSDPLFPVRVPLEAEGHGRVGWLLLGPRPDGSLFGKSECDAIEEIAEPVARAVEVALRRQEREQQLESRLQAIEMMIATLSKRIAANRRPARG
jgi:hypothetical protein